VSSQHSESTEPASLPDNVFPFPKKDTEPRTSTHYVRSSELAWSPQSTPRRLTTESPPVLSIRKGSQEMLDEAFDRITDAADANVGRSERSNCFDEWKDYLRLLIRVEGNFSRPHRVVLGALVSATIQMDMSNASEAALKVFRDITNVIRQPRISKVERQRAIRDLLAVKVNVTLPLSVQGLEESQAKSIESMLAALLRKTD